MKKWEEHNTERYAPSVSCQSLGGIPVGYKPRNRAHSCSISGFGGGRPGGGSNNPETSNECPFRGQGMVAAARGQSEPWNRAQCAWFRGSEVAAAGVGQSGWHGGQRTVRTPKSSTNVLDFRVLRWREQGGRRQNPETSICARFGVVGTTRTPKLSTFVLNFGVVRWWEQE